LPNADIPEYHDYHLPQSGNFDRTAFFTDIARCPEQKTAKIANGGHGSLFFPEITDILNR